MADEQVVQTDANEEVQASSEPANDGEVSQQDTQESDQQESAPGAAESVKEAEKAAPFHEHPRWQEMQTTNKELTQKLSELEKQVTQQDETYQAANKPTDPLLERLAKIDPEFGKAFKELMEFKTQHTQSAEDTARRFEQQDVTQYQQSVDKRVAALHEQYKVPEEMRDHYNDKLIAMSNQNPDLNMNDLDRVFKEVHDGYQKFIEGIQRTERAKYVTDKRTDASKPTSMPKGSPAKSQTAKPDPSTIDVEELKHSIAQEALRLNSQGSDF